MKYTFGMAFISLSVALLAVTANCGLALGADLATRYTWMLPKTIIDTTITYSFQGCTDNVLKFKITPTLVEKPVADLQAGQIRVEVDQLKSWTQDNNISLQTFANSHILSSIGSQPTDQTAQIVGNIVGGVTKLVAVALGVPAVAVDAVHNPLPKPICNNQSVVDSAPYRALEIDQLNKNILTYQKQLADGAEEAEQKKLTAAIQAAQTLITELQSKLSFTVKTTIDPGVSPTEVDAQNETTSSTAGNGTVDNSGLIATICPSKKQIDDLKLFSNWNAVMPSVTPNSTCTVLPSLKVSMYLDFPNAHSTPWDNNDQGSSKSAHAGPYEQTAVTAPNLYREPGYIPVLVWRGVKPTKIEPQETDDEGNPIGNVLLAPPTTLPFGQFGVAQALPFDAKTFQTLTWAITFLEDGQITNAAYGAKAQGVSLTSILFGTGASAANSIATEMRSATTQANASAETEATQVQGQSDLIYQNERLKTCVVSPSACTQK